MTERRGGNATGRWERVEFASRRGVALVGCWHLAGGRRAVILCHGMESSKEGDKSVALAQALAAGGCDVLRFDFSYVGESAGRFEDLTVTGEVEDLAGAWRLARERVAGPIGIIGSSLGGTVALLFAAAEAEVAAVATIAAVATPGASARALPQAERERWRREGFADLHGIRVGAAFLDNVEKLDVPAALRQVRCPIFLAHGTDDAIVPWQAADTIAGAVAGKAQVRLYPGVDHRFSDPARRAEMLSEVVDFMMARLAEADESVGCDVVAASTPGKVPAE